MKKLIIILVITIFIPCFSFSRNIENEYEKLIQEYDIDSLAKKADNVNEFWNIVVTKNPRFAYLFKALNDGTHLAKKAYGKVHVNDEEHELYIQTISKISYYDDILEKLQNDLGDYVKLNMYVIDMGEINASADYQGNMLLDKNLLIDDDFTYEMTLGICAHETAHYLLQHVLAAEYKIAKQDRKNKIIAGISAGLDATSAMAAAVIGGVKSDGLEERLDNYIASAQKDTERFKYKYSREQEIEADIIAFRFLDYIGVGGDKYIEALEMLKRKIIDFSSEESDHPSTQYRINVLKYMQAHPEIIRKAPKYIIQQDANSDEINAIKNK
ncbi:MAG: M48 family metalloprotease [Prevotella sp.]|nr:M48 family metalloprotease [Prevotella sp.]